MASTPSPFCAALRSEEHTSELQSLRHLVCRLLLEKKKCCQIQNRGNGLRDSSSDLKECPWCRKLCFRLAGTCPGQRSAHFCFFFFNDTATTEIYTLSLHDALPIWKIVFTASLLSFQGGITVPGYAAAKGGVAQLTKALANEWAGRNVQV